MRIWYSDAFKAGYEKGFAKAKKLLDDIDTITVVRCKDCKYCSYSEEHEILWCDGTRIVPFNGYCYKGKKKDDTREKKS